MQYVRKGQNVK
uniref:Uncharacterized protein n=1 Tax=Rhizophora mucronata TaxID=61149 RepID=A0A2P2NEG6_RHIMU